MKLKDKIAIVTGAGRGIGRAAALAFAQEGAHLVLVARSVSEIEAVAEEVRSVGREALPVQTDVANKSDVDSMVQQTLERFGKVDILVNTAGVVVHNPIPDIREEDWDLNINVNLKLNLNLNINIKVNINTNINININIHIHINVNINININVNVNSTWTSTPTSTPTSTST